MRNIMKFADGAEADRIICLAGNPSSVTIAEQEISGITVGGEYTFFRSNGFSISYLAGTTEIYFRIEDGEVKTGERLAGVRNSSSYAEGTVNITAVTTVPKKYIEPWTSYTPDGNVMKFNAEYMGSPLEEAYGLGSDSTSSTTVVESFTYNGTVPVEDGDYYKRDFLKTEKLGEAPISYDGPVSVLHRWVMQTEPGTEVITRYIFSKERNPKVGSYRFYNRFGRTMFDAPMVTEILEYGGGPRVDYNQSLVSHNVPIGPKN